LCNGSSDGTATITPQGGFTPFTYSWAPVGQVSQTAINLPAGAHTGIVADSRGCMVTEIVTLGQPTPIIANVTTKDVRCFGESNGEATVIASGGTPGYTYSWNTAPAQNVSTATGLPAGTYSVVVKDANNCELTKNAIVVQPAQLNATVNNVTDASCFGKADGSITVGVNGGTSPYNYQWNSSPTHTNPTADNLSAGNYSVAVGDDKGCGTNASASITEPGPVVLVASADVTICKNDNTTISALTTTGGSGGYFWMWNQGLPSAQQHTVTPLATTTYQISAFDMFGCPSNIDNVTVEVTTLAPEDLTIGGTPLICNGGQGTVFTQINNPTSSNITYSWVPNIGTGPGAYTVTPAAAPAVYTVTATNHCGVSVTKSFEINFLPMPVVNLIASAHDGCEEHTVDFTDVTLNSSDPAGSWLWNFGDGNTSTAANPQHTFKNAGQYKVSLTVTTVGGCSDASSTANTTVTVYPKPTASFTYNPNPIFALEPIFFKNQSQGGVSYRWDFGDGNRSIVVNPQHIYRSAENYTISLTAISDLGCRDTYHLDVIASGNVKVPNAFTPNPNGPNGGRYYNNGMDNSVFFPFADGVEEFNMQIFNRWGELIFESKDINIGWDGYYRGELCKQDVYVWKIAVRFNDNRIYNKMGDITLLR
nr:PKD domain-containing protein [Bacteroidota bacterium]